MSSLSPDAVANQRWADRCGQSARPLPQVWHTLYRPAKPHGYPPARRVQALKLDVDGMNVRRIARVLDVHHQTVINWRNPGTDRVSNPPPTPAPVDTVEVAAVYTFVGHTKTAYLTMPQYRV